jgi:hypothetical protein
MKIDHLPNGALRACFALALALALAAAASGQTTVNLKGMSYSLWDQPNGLLDGPCAMGAWSNLTEYHDLEAVSYSGIWYRAIQQSGPSSGGAVTPGTNAAYWVASPTNLTGSGANFTCNLWGTAGSGRAQAGNPAYSALKSGAQVLTNTAYYASPGVNIPNIYGLPNDTNGQFQHALNCALAWAAEGADDADTNHYLACAKTVITSFEDFMGGGFLCDESVKDCGGNGTFGSEIDYSSYYLGQIGMTYSIVRDKLTSGQIATFMNKLWNDNSSSNNGLGLSGAPSSSCNKPALKGAGGPPPSTGSASGTITTHSYYCYITGSTSSPCPGTAVTLPQTLTVTGSGTHFTTDLIVGDVIFGVGHVASITNDTSLQLAAPSAVDLSAVALNYATLTPAGSFPASGVVAAWDDSKNTCGLVWNLKHHNFTPQVGTGTYTTSYPVEGGGSTVPSSSGGGPADFNLNLTKYTGFIALALATATDDARAGTALTQYFNWFYTYSLPEIQAETTAFWRPRDYVIGRDQWMHAQIMLGLKNSVPSYTLPGAQLWQSRVMPAFYMNTLVDKSGGIAVPFGGTGGGIDTPGNDYAIVATLLSSWLYPSNTNDVAAVNYWVKTLRRDYTTSAPYPPTGPYQGNTGAFFAHWIFPYSDPGNAGTNPSGLVPSQYIFDETDLNPSGGPTASATTCTSSWYTVINGLDCRMTYWVSRTGWASTDSIVMGQDSFWDGQDHQDQCGQNQLALTIYRQGFLLAGDWTSGDNCGNGDTGSGGFGEAMIQVGGSNNWNSFNGTTGWQTAELRWAGAHPTGVSSSKYAYSMFDAKASYQSTVTNALREVAHLKGGSQDYVIVHDYVAVPSPTSIGSNWPLFLGPDQVWGRTGVVTATSWASGMQAQVVADSTSSLIMQAVPLSANSLAAIDYGPGTRGYARIEQLCASTNGTSCNSSASSMESIVVLKAANTVSPTMPTLTHLASSGAAVVQVADSSAPKVAAFVTGASTVSSLSFTSTHSGTAQYLIAGLTAGIYNVTVGGSTVSGSPFTVNSGDNTLYFESTSGAVTIGGGGVTLSCDMNQDGVVNVLDVQIAISAAQGLIPCLPQYQLDGSGACSVIDVQRVVAASLGASCKIGS